VTAAAAGLNHTCALATGGAYCWGYDNYGQLGNGAATTMMQNTPVQVTGIAAPTAIASGKFHSCAIDAGIVKCWGYNAGGQLGDGTTTNRNNPVTVTLPTAASQLSLADLQSCALLTNGDVYCWGFNVNGEVGTGTASPMESTPRRVVLPAQATQVSHGSGGGCARLVTGETYCWGLGGHGQLGDGTERDLLQPEAITNLVNADGVARTETGGCMLRAGALSCWGAHYLLGNGDQSIFVPASPAFPGCTP
jgi:alpha-tubulin suppressor-like RCC1 family protein